MEVFETIIEECEFMSINQYEQELEGVKAFISKKKQELHECTDARVEARLKRVINRLEEYHTELAGGLKE